MSTDLKGDEFRRLCALWVLPIQNMSFLKETVLPITKGGFCEKTLLFYNIQRSVPKSNLEPWAYLLCLGARGGTRGLGDLTCHSVFGWQVIFVILHGTEPAPLYARAVFFVLRENLFEKCFFMVV